jgi:hypothetical protein
VGTHRGGVLTGPETCFRPGRATDGVDRQCLHGGKIDHDAAVGRAVPHAAVAAASDCELEASLAREPHDPCDVADAGRADDRSRTMIEAAIEQRARLLVAHVGGRDHVAVQGLTQVRHDFVSRSVGAGCHRVLHQRSFDVGTASAIAGA